MTLEDCLKLFETDPREDWKDIPGFEGKYAISTFGSVMAYPHSRRGTPIILTVGYDRWGYPYVDIYDGTGKFKRKRNHQLVLLTFVGLPPEGMESRHLNDQKGNCRLSNLEYGTRSQNCKEAFSNGRRPYVFAYKGFVPKTALGGDRSNAYYLKEGYQRAT